jgi:hypothetical protein
VGQVPAQTPHPCGHGPGADVSGERRVAAQLLVHAGAAIDARLPRDGTTALFCAAHAGYEGVVSYSTNKRPGTRSGCAHRCALRERRTGRRTGRR